MAPGHAAMKRDIILLKPSTRTSTEMELLRGPVQKTDATQASLLIPRWSSAAGPAPPASHDPLDLGHVFAVEQRRHWTARDRPLDLVHVPVHSIKKISSFPFFRTAPRWKREAPQGWNAPRVFELNEAEIFPRKRGKI